MFDNISPKYDLLNRLLSAGIDVQWRKKAIRLLAPQQPKTILDVATGTADLALESLKLKPERVVGVDISEGMLDFGRKKISKRGVAGTVTLETGDSENLRFADAEFDVTMASFGVRNFENLEKGLAEMHRVTRPGGTIMVLEFSQPERFPFKQLYNFYFKNILPLIGRSVSADEAAYSYLPASVQVFPYGERFNQILTQTGFTAPKCIPLTFGIASIYLAQKPQ